MRRILGVVGVAVSLASASPARADHATELAAQALYDKAIELMKAGKLSSACALLTESQRLDPAAGTQYRLAECFEKTGRPEAAWRLYTEVAEASKKAGRKDREAQARERAELVRNLLQRLIIKVSPELARAEGLVVTRDGQVVPREEWNLEIPVAPGEHTVEARATRKKAWQGTATARTGATGEVRVPLLEDVAVVEAPVSKPDVILPVNSGAVEAPRREPNKTVVLVGASLTAVSLGMGGAFLGLSFAKAGERDTALKEHPCAYDSHSCSHDVASAEAGRTRSGNASMWSFIAAGALGVATVTYVLVPRSSKNGNGAKTMIHASPRGVGLTLAMSW